MGNPHPQDFSRGRKIGGLSGFLSVVQGRSPGLDLGTKQKPPEADDIVK